MNNTIALQNAVATMYLDHHGWLHAWLWRKLGCAHTAADLAQDTFVRIMHAPQAVSIREPRAFLTTVAHGLVVNHWRRQDIERAYLAALATLPQPQYPSAEAQRIVVETLEAIAAVLDGLPVRSREIFLLSQLDGLTYPQIAARLQLTVNLVQKNMLKAFAHCYQVLYA